MNREQNDNVLNTRLKKWKVKNNLGEVEIGKINCNGS